MKPIGEKVLLNGKNYEITGYCKRSYLLKGENGKIYKCGPDKLERIEAGVSRPRKPRDPAQPASPGKEPPYLVQMVAMNKLFKKQQNVPVNFPETEGEIMSCFLQMSGDLSPENLHCDGEISAAAANRKRREIMQAWQYLEAKLGRKVTEEVAYAWNDRNRSGSS